VEGEKRRPSDPLWEEWGHEAATRAGGGFFAGQTATSKNWARAIPEYRGAISRERDHAGTVVRSWGKRPTYSGNKAARSREVAGSSCGERFFGFGAMCHEHSPLPLRGGEWGHSCRPDVPRAGVQECLSVFLRSRQAGPTSCVRASGETGMRGSRRAGKPLSASYERPTPSKPSPASPPAGPQARGDGGTT